jgi:hypothetical protein
LSDYQDEQLWLRLAEHSLTPGSWPYLAGPIAGSAGGNEANRLAPKETYRYQLHPILWWRLREAFEAGLPVGIRHYAGHLFAGRLITGGNILYLTGAGEPQPYQTTMPR